MWTADTQTALEGCKRKKSGMKECNARQNNLLLELSSWCLQDLGTKVNRKKTRDTGHNPCPPEGCHYRNVPVV